MVLGLLKETIEKQNSLHRSNVDFVQLRTMECFLVIPPTSSQGRCPPRSKDLSSSSNVRVTNH